MNNDQLQEFKDLMIGILEANVQDELRQAVKDGLKDSLQRSQKHWDQCAQMEKTVADNGNSAFKKLRKKIVGIIADPNKWFYIGYTNQDLGSQFYLWNTHPENAIFNDAVADHHLVKSYTYYTTLQGTDRESEYALITAFHNEPRCFNDTHPGTKATKGIVYVLVYEVV